MNYYQDGTIELLKQLAHEHLDIAEKDGAVVLAISDEDFEAMLPTEDMLVKAVLLRPRQDQESLKALAQRYGVANTTISAVTRKNAGRPVERNLALSAIMLMDPMPDAEEVDHMLMQLSLPGLYVLTGKLEVNRRNWLLREILEYCGRHQRPQNGWLNLANRVLIDFGMKPLSKHPVVEEQTGPSEARLERWRAQIQSVGIQDYSLMRENFLKRYMEQHNLTDYGCMLDTYAHLGKCAFMSPETVRSLFAKMSNENSIGNRTNLIALAVALGCSLKETNTILLQANKALLYPNRSRKEEIEWVRKLCQRNPGELL